MQRKSELPIVCPCFKKSPLKKSSTGYLCSLSDCFHSKVDGAFPIIEDTPVIISDVVCDTVCDPGNIKSYVPRLPSRFAKVKALVFGESKATKYNAARFLELVKHINRTPNVLIIGSGEHGSGAAGIWTDSDICIHGVDIYKSPSVDIVCDAHYIALESNYYDGVWIQAVLEHVVDPKLVVSEIRRVLKDGGIVYAETPFMQQVHEGAYDFTRFTVLGHRYLFKSFELIEIGGIKGAETVLAWSVRYFVLALSRSKRFARVAGALAHVALRPFALLISNKSMFDSSSGTYFLGRKSDAVSLSHKDLVELYRGAL